MIMAGPSDSLRLKIITPRKIIMDEYINSITAFTLEGEITVLPNHMNLFSVLDEGVLKIKINQDENLLAIGGGFLQTDGKEINILVSRAYGQTEIDEQLTRKALENAQKIIKESKDKLRIQEARTLLRRSIIDMKLIRKKKRPPVL